MAVEQKVLDEIALNLEEYHLLVRRLGREPNPLELGMFGALWSEHCGYKNSKPLLRLFPTQGKGVLTRIGQENAGAVDIGEGLAAVMKMESHNHPSAIEPFQGAATGVGGIVRDIFAMGARPIALLNPLRFGPLDDARSRYLFDGVVAGIASYGNCLGIPNVGGEVFFSPAYLGNPLVNVLCLGIAEKGKLVKARAQGKGNTLMLVGADTGRDGIHGATFASVQLDEASQERRPAVQVGNPFLEKLLIEACLELAATDYYVGIQDLGAAGLTSAAVECADKGGTGIEIDVSRVPRRETGMSPYEVMLSESQERMLIIVKQGCEEKVADVFRKWDLECQVVGRVTDDGLARIKEGQKVVGEMPVSLLTDPPLYRRKGTISALVLALQNWDLSQVPDQGKEDAGATLLQLLSSPNIASKEEVYRQYDHQVLINTVLSPGEDAALLRVKGTRKGLAMATDGNGRYCYLDPYQGGAIAVAEAARNVVCIGARPLAVTDCLNFGNPERPEVYYQLKECIRGMAQACRVLDTPVISGNVSLYNETNGQPIYPTPIVGMLGLLENVEKRCTTAFKEVGDLVVVLGGKPPLQKTWQEPVLKSDVATLAASEYLERCHNLVAGRPHIDLELEKRVQRLCLVSIEQGLLRSAHDCSDGGLAVALAESCIAGGLGLQVVGLRVEGRVDAALFGEEQSRILVSLNPSHWPRLEALAKKERVPLVVLGAVGGDRLTLGQYLDLPLEAIAKAWRRGLA
ncbi:MAG: phosphoribosylformylglycinamidine synthase subunit PurL [Chloroflexi bacterium]|nr:phosphoribosylformylglycinamidine synthase subunit PurL [Chloroflexota bacterium]